MNRAVSIASVGFVLAGLFGAGHAQASTFCAELPADVSCTQNFTGTTTSVQAAVDAAEANPGPDSVKVGPGTFVMPSPVYLSSSGDDNQLTLTGTGPSTVLKGSDPADPEIHFHAPQGSSINRLTVSIPDDAGTTAKRGLVLTGDAPVANDLDVNFVANTGEKTTGVVLQDGATLKDSRVVLYNSNVNTAVASTGSGTQTIQGSHLTAFRDVDQRNTRGTLEVTKSALIAIGVGGLNQGGTLNIRDSVIVNPFGSGDGIYVGSKGAFSDTLLEGTTMLGTPGSLGAVVTAAYGDPTPANTRFRLHSSVIYGHDYAIAHSTFYAEDTLNIGVNASAYDSTRVSAGVGLGTPTLDVQGLVDLSGVDPKFKDLATGDYSLAAGSPLLDAGQAADPPVGSTDMNGNLRACHGTAAGVIRRDIGAYEFKTDPADDCTYSTASIAAPSGAATDTTRSFAISASKAGSTFSCSLDGAPFTTCTSPYVASGLAAGSHDLKVRARDAFGNVQQAATVTPFTVESHPGTGGGGTDTGGTGGTGGGTGGTGNGAGASGSGAGGGSGTGGTPAPAGSPTGSSDTVPDMLAKLLVPSGQGAAITKIAASGYTFSVVAPVRGKLSIRWTSKVKGKKVLVASGSATVVAGKQTKVKLKLTKAGKKLLKRSKRLKVSTKVTFTPTGGKPVTTTGSFRLK